MVNSTTDNDPLQQQPLSKGSPVEVSSDDEGFRGAWYMATIVETPPKSTSKKRKKALVRYTTLLADDGKTPLTEYVDPAYIRPLPPADKHSAFHVNDVVDAKYRDGWWTGVVRKVLGKSKYRVYFDNPPDIIDFDRKDLRVHWDLIDNKWVRPQKQKSTGSIFSSGTAVEVNVENENLHDVWYPAIVVKENEDDTFLVKYQSSRNDDESGTVKVVVDSLHIRPTPPRYADRNYELLERVDAMYDFGWRTGVITKVLTGKRYTVFYKHGNEGKELSQSDLRPNVEWIDGDWVSKSKELVIAPNEQEQIGNALRGTQKIKVVGELESSVSTKENTKAKTPLIKMNKNATKLTSAVGNSTLHPSKKAKLETSNGNTSRSRSSKKPSERVKTLLSDTGHQLKDMPSETSSKEGTPKTGGKDAKSLKTLERCAKSESPLAGATTTTKRHKAGSADVTPHNLVKRNVRARKTPSKGPQVSATGKEGTAQIAEEINEGEIKTKEVEIPIILGLSATFTKALRTENSIQSPSEESLKLKGDQKNTVNDSVRNENMEIKEHKVGVGNQKKNARTRRSVVMSPKASDAASEDSRGRKSDDCKTKAVHLVALGVSDMALDDQPLSTWIGGIITSGGEESRLTFGRLDNGWNEENGLVDVPIESLAMDASGGTPLDNDQSLPFVKKSPLWRTIESMDVFQIVPQKPHFQPLAETREEFREGSAIGIMVTFAGLFEKISMLHFDGPTNTFDNISESLCDLEKHGFDVTLLRSRLNKLVSIKEGHSQQLGERENAERKMTENTKEMTKFDEEMEEIEKKITELKEQLSSIKSEKETKNLKVGSLKLHVNVLDKLILNASHDFKKIATAHGSCRNQSDGVVIGFIFVLLRLPGSWFHLHIAETPWIIGDDCCLNMWI